jgi:hypothetical protein
MTRIGRIFTDKQIFYAFLPLLLLLACLALFNLLAIAGRQAEATPSPAATAGDEGRVEATAVPNPTTPAAETTPASTPSPTAPATATPPPTVPATATITLLGPPPAAIFTLENPITFYWQWPEPLPEAYVFRLYLEAGGREVVLGEAAAPNVGRGYRLRIDPGDYLAGSGTASWQVRLEETAVAGRTLLSSEERTLQIR